MIYETITPLPKTKNILELLERSLIIARKVKIKSYQK